MKTASVFLSVLTLLIWSAIAYSAIDETMLLALSFDSAQGGVATDSSLYGFDGKIEGAKSVDGKFGKALEFDGTTDIVIVPDDPKLMLMEGGTLMAWAYIMTEEGHASWNRIIIKSVDNGGTTNGYDFLFDRAAGYSIRFCTGGVCTSHFAMETDSWHHVAVTFDNEMITVYADGEQVGEIAQAGPVVDSSGIDVHIGNGAVIDRPYNGILDEVRIFDRALEAEEIEWHMARGTREIVAVEPRSKLATAWGIIKAD